MPNQLSTRLANPIGVEIEGPRWSGSAFEVDAAATTVGAAVLDGARSWAATSGPPPESCLLHRRHALAASSGWLEVDGRRPPIWSDLSGYYLDRDGRFVQLHCNFAHHAAGVVEHLGLDPGSGRRAVEAAIARRDGIELESELIEIGMVGAAERTLEEWAAHPHATATADLDLCSVEPLGSAEPLPDDRPLRVLDFSRVLAGPVCGQTLAATGAEVLRVSADHLPAVETAVIATGFGKRNTTCDLRTANGRRQVTALMADADVVIDAYRPGALARHGLGPEDLAELRPGVVVVQISAFDWVGPWAGRRGFDSIIQTTTGISRAGATASGRDDPTPLPFQAHDYATGYLGAAAALHLLAHQRKAGGSWLVRLSLLRTRNWLMALGGPTPFEPEPLPDPSPWADATESDFGVVRTTRPLVGRWASGPRRLGTSEPGWNTS